MLRPIAYKPAITRVAIGLKYGKEHALDNHCLFELCLYIDPKSVMSLLLKESALSEALARLVGDIDQKLDRLELDPLRDYFGEY